ncbi:hypothetical protein AB0M97_26540 [Streptomyces sp. NPDC051207]|uniref:hypothetical protein n=1 Tax=Streptomyces sp. NPDC051207 TaxID=3154641 RepID=UPI003416C4FA
MEDWVRTTAIPIIVTGGREVTPLPPQLDISTGYDDLRSELPRAGAASAAERGEQRIQAAVARAGLTEILVPLMGSDMSDTISEWAATLTNDAVLERVNHLAQARHSHQEALKATGQLAAEVRGYMGRHHEPDRG